MGYFNIHKPEVRLMDKRRGLKRLAGLLLRHFSAANFRSSLYTMRSS